MTRNSVPLPIDGNLELGYSTHKKRFSINGDVNTVIELDPSDFGVVSRLSKALPKFEEMSNEWEKLNSIVEKIDLEDETNEQAIDEAKEITNTISNLEMSVKDLIDDCFDSKISDILLGNSSPFSPVNGFFKYEHIISALMSCYEDTIKAETPKFNKRKVQKHTNKYTKR